MFFRERANFAANFFDFLTKQHLYETKNQTMRAVLSDRAATGLAPKWPNGGAEVAEWQSR